MEKKEICFFGKLFTGQGRNRRLRYVKSVDWVDDRIVLTFSDQPCSVPLSVVRTFQCALDCGVNPFPRFSFSFSQDPDSVMDSACYDLFVFVRRFLDTYGCEVFNEVINSVLVSEVTPDA